MWAGIFLTLAGLVATADSTFVMVFATNNAQRDPFGSHSFATWVRVNEADEIQEVFTISWTGEHGVRFLRGYQRPHNRDLEESFVVANRRGLCVTMWGPFRTTCEFHRLARCRFQELTEGERCGTLYYTVVDGITKHLPIRAFNCIHALTHIGGIAMTGNRHGARASEFIVQKWFDRGFICPRRTEDEWVWEAVRPENSEVTRMGAATMEPVPAE